MRRHLLTSAPLIAVLAGSIPFTGCTRWHIPSKLEADPSPVSGVWGLVQRHRDADGDERIDRHELQLQRRGRQVIGFWSRSTTWVTKDGRHFRCSGRSRHEAEARILVGGEIQGKQATIRQIKTLSGKPGNARCPGAEPPPSRCSVQRASREQLVATCGGATLRFRRRLDSPIPLALVLGQRGSVTGVWTWHFRSRDRQGDIKIEDEVWHLLQRGSQVEGYYDRLVVVRSGDGRRFVCNNAWSYSNLARFRVEGQIGKDGVMRLREVSFDTRDGRCETGKRVLDEYQGVLDSDSALIQLRWPKGAQLLYRRY